MKIGSEKVKDYIVP